MADSVGSRGACMSKREGNVYSIGVLNGWPLFFLIAALNALIMVTGFSIIGMDTSRAVVDLIRLSVQISAPWIYITFIASALVKLYPSHASRWVLRNRRYLGLSFAAAMGWQLIFIIVLFVLYMPFYLQEIHKTFDLIGRTFAYLLLFAMTISSFYPVRRRMRPQHWRWLHLIGVWFMFLSMWTSYGSIIIIPNAPLIAYVLFILASIALIIRLKAYRLAKVKAQS